MIVPETVIWIDAPRDLERTADEPAVVLHQAEELGQLDISYAHVIVVRSDCIREFHKSWVSNVQTSEIP